MTKSYSIADARSHLAEILDAAAAGDDVEITRRGKPAAVVISTKKLHRLERAAGGFASAYERFRNRFDLADVGIDGAWAAALRSRERGRDVDL